MKKYQIKLRIWFIIGMLLGSFLSQTGLAVATTIDQSDQITETSKNQEQVTDESKKGDEKDHLTNFLKENQLVQGKDGKLYTTTAENYTTASISENLGFNTMLRGGNSIVYVDPSAHISNIDIRLSNGGREYGWYGKRVNNEIAMCIEQGVAVDVGANGGYTAVLQNTALMERISLIKYYGIILPGYSLYREIMTQILTWEQQGITPTSISGEFSMADYQTFKTNVITNVNKFYTKPSFDGQTVTLKVGKSVTLTDTTGAFDNYENSPITAIRGLTINKQGNNVTITANQEASTNNEVEFQYNIASSYKGAIVVYENPYTQDVMVGRVNDPVRVNFRVNVQKNGNVCVRKVDRTTKQPLAGAVFRFTASNGQTKEITTGSDGYAAWNDLLVDTKVTIEEIKAPNGYILNAKPQTVTIKANETTTVTLDNQEQLANLTVIKEDEETGNQPQGAATLLGAVYELTDANGKSVGKLTMKEVEGLAKAEIKGLKLGTYSLQEIEPPEGYNLDPTKYTVNLTYAGQNETVALHSKTVTDRVIKGHVEGYKFGSRPLISHSVLERLMTPKSQDNKPPLEGVELTATSHTTGQKYVQVTGKNGYFKFEHLPYDTYTIEETKGVDGYLLIEPFEVTVTEEGYTHFFLLEDRIIETRLRILKEDSETGERIPLAGTSFKIWDRWANEGEGAYVKMRENNSLELTDTFVTNDQGEIVTSEMLAWGVDRYELREIKAPDGYILTTEPVIFSVTEENANGLITLHVKNDSQKGLVKVNKTVETAIHTAVHDSDYGEYAQFEFDQLHGAGFRFKIEAAEDVVTPDGTVRFKKGEIIQVDNEDYILETGEDGTATSPAFLYIGNYYLIEVGAPAGVVLPEEPVPFSIEYAGQEVSVSTSDVEIENFLQEINIRGQKEQEVVIDWQEGEAIVDLEPAKNDQVFSLRLAEELLVGETTLEEDTALGFAVVKEGLIAFEGIKMPNQWIELYLQEVDAGNDHVLDETKYFFTYDPSTNDSSHNIDVSADQTEREENEDHSEDDEEQDNDEIIEPEEDTQTEEAELIRQTTSEDTDVGEEPETPVASQAILNRLARASVQLVKVDGMDTKPLEGVEFDLIRLEGNQEQIVIGTYKTDKEGKILVENLPTGKYMFVETKPLDWYHENNQEYEFEITAENNGETIQIEVENNRLDLEIETLFAEADTGAKIIDPTVDNRLIDYAWVKGGKESHEYFVVTEYINKETEKVIDTATSSFISKGEDEQEILFHLTLPANTMKDGDQLVATHMVYSDEEMSELVNEHFDLENTEQTVNFSVTKTTEIPQTGSYNAWEEFKELLLNLFM